MARDLLPRIHSSGIFELKHPLTTLVNENMWYTCIAIRKLEEIKLLGIDVFEEYYKPLNLLQSDYERDWANGSCIITIISDRGEVLNFPSFYLLSFPSGTGILYAVAGLAVDLGALPVEKDLTSIEDDIKDLVFAHLGVKARTRILNLSPTEIVSQITHDRLETARAANVTTTETNYSKMQRLETENQALKDKVDELEAWIRWKESNP